MKALFSSQKTTSQVKCFLFLFQFSEREFFIMFSSFLLVFWDI